MSQFLPIPQDQQGNHHSRESPVPSTPLAFTADASLLTVGGCLAVIGLQLTGAALWGLSHLCISPCHLLFLGPWPSPVLSPPLGAHQVFAGHKNEQMAD